MNKKLIFSVLLVVCLLAVVSVAAFAQSSPSVRWEYTYFVQNTDQMNDAQIQRLNQLGAEGWELVAYGGYNGKSLILKRRLP